MKTLMQLMLLTALTDSWIHHHNVFLIAVVKILNKLLHLLEWKPAVPTLVENRLGTHPLRIT